MSDQSRRRIPGFGVLIVILFLVLPICGVAWWLNRPKPGAPPPGPPLSELDVVCLGRIDGENAVANLEPSVPGKVVEVYATEGQRVGAKTKLLKLDDESFRLREEEARSALAAAGGRSRRRETGGEAPPHPQGNAGGGSCRCNGADCAAARRVYEEKKKANSFGTVTVPELIAAESEIKQYEQLEGVEKSRLEELKLADPALKVRAAVAKRTTAEIALKQAEKAVGDCVLLAPSAGTVLRVQASVGEAVAPGTTQPPIVFRPDGALVVRAELEQEFLGRVKPGMKATVRDDVRADSPTWTGSVLRVGQVVARKRSVLLEPGELNDVRTVECVIALPANPEGLLVGQRMRIRIGRGE